MHRDAEGVPKNSFITLTYDEFWLPNDGSLNTQHWQKFAKKLRKNVGKFRFLQIGEYGDDMGRPHYHALLFGQDFREDRTPVKLNNSDFPQWESPKLTETWGMGIATVSDLTEQSAAYCCRYVIKKLNGQKAKDKYSRLDMHTGEITEVQPEKATMSRRPGIGRLWIEKHWKDLRHGYVVINGKERAMPKYYWDILHEKDPIREAELKKKQRHREIQEQKKGNRTQDKNEIREKIALSKQNLKRDEKL